MGTTFTQNKVDNETKRAKMANKMLPEKHSATPKGPLDHQKETKGMPQRGQKEKKRHLNRAPQITNKIEAKDSPKKKREQRNRPKVGQNPML